jgi:hypothetical protein
MRLLLRRLFFGLRTECSWCGRLLRRRGVFGLRLVSHAVCWPLCRQAREWELTLLRNAQNASSELHARPQFLP